MDEDVFYDGSQKCRVGAANDVLTSPPLSGTERGSGGEDDTASDDC